MHAPFGHSERSEEPRVPRATGGRFFAALRMTKRRPSSSSFTLHPSSFDSRPLIGVTGPDEGGGAAWWFTRFAVWLARGRGRRLTPRRPRRLARLPGLGLR